MNMYEAIHSPNHDIVKQYRKGLTAVVDRCVYMYPTIGTSLFRKVLFVAVLVETRACRPRDAYYPVCARHLTPLYVPVSPCALSATCKPCPMALLADSTVHCSRPPARNLDLSSSDHSQGPCVGFIYIQLSKLFKNGPGMPINTRCRA